jgi:hypothetical protein
VSSVRRLISKPFFWHGNGFKVFKAPKGLLRRDSGIYANITEVVIEGTSTIRPHAGAAPMWIGNIVTAAERDEILIRINVDWESNLPCRVQVLVSND